MFPKNRTLYPKALGTLPKVATLFPEALGRHPKHLGVDLSNRETIYIRHFERGKSEKSVFCVMEISHYVRNDKEQEKEKPFFRDFSFPNGFSLSPCFETIYVTSLFLLTDCPVFRVGPKSGRQWPNHFGKPHPGFPVLIWLHL